MIKLQVCTPIEDIKIIKISGKINNSSSDQAQGEIISLIDRGCALILDMSNCDYISNAGLRTLLIIAKQLSQQGACGVLVGLNEEVKDIMQITGFDNIFQDYSDIPEAVEAIREIRRGSCIDKS